MASAQSSALRSSNLGGASGEKSTKSNFFKEDPELKRQMATLDAIASKLAFSGWKVSFLQVVLTFLEHAGSVKAEEAYEKFTKNVASLKKSKSRVQTCLDNGSLSTEKVSVKARRFLAELKASLTVVCVSLALLLPGNLSEKVQYTNYHMGAILIRDGFQSYGTLIETDTALLLMKEEALQHVADKQVLEEIDSYHEKLKMFCAIMADLGIMRIAKKAQEIAKLDEEDPEEDLEAFKATANVTESPSSNDNVDADTLKSSSSKAPAVIAAPPIKEISHDSPPRVKEVVRPPKVSAPVPPPAPPSPLPPAPPPAPIVEKKENKKKLEQQELETITITATHKAPVAPIVAKLVKPKTKKIRKKVVRKQSSDDLPRTAKPKAKAKMPGNDGGRGTGRMLSKAEAKEKRVPYKNKNLDHTPEDNEVKKKLDNLDEENEDDAEDDADANDNADEKQKGDASIPKDGDKKKKESLRQKMKNLVAPADAPKKKEQKATTAKNATNLVPITINKMDGTKLKLMVDPVKHTLGHIKTQLEKQTGMPVEKQCLSMRNVGQEFQLDEKKAAFYGIKEDSELELDPRWIEVNVKIYNGDCHTLKLEPALDTSDSIKRKIARKSDLAAPKQLLTFNAKELPGNKIVKFMGIQDGSILNIDLMKKVSITVITMEKKKIKLMVDPSKDTIADVKGHLRKDTGLPVDNQELIMNGVKLDDDNKVAQDYYIEAGSELYIEPKAINVTVEMPDGKLHTLQVNLASDMSDLITAMVEKEADMATSALGGRVFKFGDKELSKGKTLKELKIRDGSKIKLDSNTTTITMSA